LTVGQDTTLVCFGSVYDKSELIPVNSSLKSGDRGGYDVGLFPSLHF